MKPSDSAEIVRGVDSFCTHLTAYQSAVRAGKKISSATTAWLFIAVCAGRGYLLRDDEHVDLETGDLVIVPADADISLLASQLGDLRLCHFGLRPEQLTGFFTAAEQQSLNATAADALRAVRLVKREGALARQYSELCELRWQQPAILVRAAMLALAIRALHDFLITTPGPAPAVSGPEQKLAELAERVPESELLARSARELAGECGCTERHFRRLFASRFGASLKHRQLEWRMERAKKILLETDAKVIDIASQCGFHSLGQFNLTFKRATHMTPSTWRKTFAAAKAKYKRQHPLLCPRQRKRQIASAT